MHRVDALHMSCRCVYVPCSVFAWRSWCTSLSSSCLLMKESKVIFPCAFQTCCTDQAPHVRGHAITVTLEHRSYHGLPNTPVPCGRLEDI